MRLNLKLKQIVLAGLLAGLGASAFSANYFFVMPKSRGMSTAAPFNVALSASALPDAVVGLPYNAGAGFDLKSVLSVTGDTAFNSALTSFAVTLGTLPAGLTVSAAGVLSGTPTVASDGSSIQVTATYKSATGAQTYQVIALNLTVSLASATLPVATQNTVYNTSGYDFKSQLSVTGDATFTANQAAFTLASGTLPAGLTLDSSGVLSGTPTVAAPSGTSFTVKASYKLKSGQTAYTIIVNGVSMQVVSISVGGSHTCAVTASGGAKCWGGNWNGQLGNNSTTDSLVPVDVHNLTAGVLSISAGGGHTCAATTSGGAKCWGNNAEGQLGNNSAASSMAPVDVPGLASGVRSFSLGDHHSCAVTSAGGAKCWGANNNGQLGNDSTTNSLVPVGVLGLASGVLSLSVGLGDGSTCAVHLGHAKCWGSNWAGQLGNDSTTNSLVPVDVLGLSSGVLSLSVGGRNACAVTLEGGAKCWGSNFFGALGNNSTSDSLVPVDVYELTSGVKSLSVGASVCAVTTSRGVKCWGGNFLGGLGNNSAASSMVPLDVPGLTGVESLSSTLHVCAVLVTGAAKCWGNNSSGQLGNNSTTNSPVPVNVAP
jgi:alpha-tubulin suppressor-like RCC1 family protein